MTINDARSANDYLMTRAAQMAKTSAIFKRGCCNKLINITFLTHK